jgi:hypothetical protein
MAATAINSFFRKVFPLLAILIIAVGPAAYARDSNNGNTHQSAVQTAPVESAITSGINGVPDPASFYSSGIPEAAGSVEGNPDQESSFRLYVTPDDQAVKALAAQISKPEDAYKMAVQWTYVSDEKLNGVADKWLMPHEFLTGTPYDSNNPLKGKVASDCEEKANTLVSLMRAEGVRPEEVRVVLGEVTFNGVKKGHAWVELFTNGYWLSLDPCWGPYWDDKAGNLVRRGGVSFDYYASHTYPVLQVWIYYNDIYYLNPREGPADTPASWH